ncbi:MAG: zinc-dependent metalloprotease [Myxococcaceae bacterium]
MKAQSPRKLLLALAVGAISALSACGEERPVINRVQPNYFDKSFFVGQDYLNPADDPEFYSQATLVDVGYGASQDGLFTSTYAQPLTRVRWVIQEDMLIARLAYEHIDSSDGKGAGKATNDGIVVAAYNIKGHFDVQRSYNAATGEESNVVEENSVDRPWHDRQYIRVDWSKNLSTDNYSFDTLSQLGVYGGIKYEPLAYYVNDPTHADAPQYSPDEGYLDVTNKAFATPGLVDLSHLGWGMDTFPACWLDPDFLGGSGPAAQCNPVELTIRQAFRRVEKNDYEPANWDGYRFQAYGAFTTERKGYARNYGMTDTQWYRFINRYNIWERSHSYADKAAMTGEVACFTPTTTPVGKDPNRDENKDGTADECAQVGSGSQCDTFNQKCSLPYRDREVKPVVWYYGQGSHPEFFEPTRDAAHEWDVALRSSVLTARYSECLRTGGSLSACAAAFPIYTGQQDDNQDAIDLSREVDDCRDGRAFAGRDCNQVADELAAKRGYAPGVVALAKLPEALVLCHSPVEANDHQLCGTPRLPADVSAAACYEASKTGNQEVLAVCNTAKIVRRGDIRYHVVNSIDIPQTPSPWGIMVDANDPLTGETIAASINVWTHVNDLASQGVVDQARYIKGELMTPDVTEGTYVKDWAQAAEAAGQKGAVAPMTAEQFQTRLADIVNVPVEKLEAIQSSPEQHNPQLQAFVRNLKQELMSIRADAMAPASNNPAYEARRKRAIGTTLEAHLTTKMMQTFAGVGAFDSQMMMSAASPLQGANPALAREIQMRRELALSEQGACVMHESLAPFAIADLANVLANKFGAFNPADDKGTQADRAEKMRRYVARKMHYAVVAHEMGHSIGLRHNFVSSSDAYNFRPQYWQLRTDNGTNTRTCTTLTPDGSCVGPRYFDPVNANERENLITMFMHSSTMDYAGEITQDLLGLGAYDFAAARMFYGDTVAVHLDPAFNAGTHRGIGVLAKTDNFGGIIGFQPTIGTGATPSADNTRDFHYSQYNKEYGLIWGCVDVDPEQFKPSTWNEERDGKWHAVADGLIVEVNGTYSRCKQQPVDYVRWDSLRAATPDEAGFPRSTKLIDPQDRTRVPYGFATDRWADLGNLSVYRHDNGADPYELFDFLITQQEVSHIFDNYRRNRQTFSIRGASGRTLNRYNTKLRDGAKGIGLFVNIYKEFALAEGYDFETLWPYVSGSLQDNLQAAGIAFDHFARQMQRPENGPHYLVSMDGTETGQRVLVSAQDASGNAGATSVIIPNGATGYFGNVSAGGRPMENALAEDRGEYDAEYTINAGSYYDKAWATMLFTESVDNFISDSRRDFLDSRYRAVSLADVFPDAYRRWLANNLTGDLQIKGVRLEVDGQGRPVVDSELYPAKGIGWTTWIPKDGPQSCFLNPDNLLCSSTPTNAVVLDPQVGWEQQKFLIAFTLLYLPENQQQTWLNQIGIWELGADADPGFPNRIEFHAPTGEIYIARTFGKETLFGKTVQKGISARILEYANELMEKAYEVDAGPDRDGDGRPDWWRPRLAANGQPRIKFDPTIRQIGFGGQLVTGREGCNATDNSQCTCTANRACMELSKYEQMPAFVRQAMRDLGMADPSMKGIY